MVTMFNACLCRSELAGRKEKDEEEAARDALYGRNSNIYDSIFTYNTERQFRSPYTFSEPDYGNVTLEKDEGGGDTGGGIGVASAQLANRAIELLCIALSLAVLALTFPLSLLFSLKFVSSFERLVVIRLGRARRISGPGAVLVLPCVDEATRVDVRVTSYALPPLQVITSDRGLVELSAMIFAQVLDPLAAHCTLRDREHTLRSLAYNTVYNNLAKQMLYDVTDPTSLGRLLTKCQEQLNAYTANKGVEVTKVTVTQVRVVKEGENQAVSLFNTLLKSDLGGQLMGQLAPHLKNFVAENGAAPPPAYHQDSTPLVNAAPPCTPGVRDAELENLIDRVRQLCDDQLAARVGKHYRIQCVDAVGGPAEIDLDLRSRADGSNGGNRWCWWTNASPTPPAEVDVAITLRKETLMALVDGSLSPLTAYINGMLGIRGAVADAAALKHLADRSKSTQ